MTEKSNDILATGKRMVGILERWYKRSLEAKPGETRAHLARLKRCSGMTLPEAVRGRTEGLMTFYRLLGDPSRGTNTPMEDRLFLIATLFTLAPNKPPEPDDKKSPQPTAEKPLPPSEQKESKPDYSSLGSHLAQLAEKREGGSLDERFESVGKRLAILIDATSAELPFRLRQTVALLGSHEIRVNWPQLIYDLERWDNDDRAAQRKWAADFWNAAPRPARAGDTEPDDKENDDVD